MSTHVSSLSLLRHAASGRLDSSFGAGRGGRGLMYGAMSRRFRLCPDKQQRSSHPACTHFDIRCTSAVTGNRSLTTANATAQPPTVPPTSSSTKLAAAAVASAAASGLGRVVGASGIAAAAAAVAAAARSSAASRAAAAATAATASAATSGPTTSTQNTKPRGTSNAPSSPSSNTAASSAPSASGTSAAAAAPASSLEGSPVPWVSLGPSLDLIQQRFRVSDVTFRLLAPRDVDAVMDMYMDNGLLDADPYWTRAWPSAIALASTLLQRPELVLGKVVADLGAGLGLAGMAAALAGAREVVLLDREPLALQCALLSAAATGLDAGPPEPQGDPVPDSGPGLGRRLRVEPLPADQLPSYCTLQLTPPYRRQQQQQRQQGEAAGGGGGGGGEAAGTGPVAVAAAAMEWEALLALARGLRRGSGGGGGGGGGGRGGAAGAGAATHGNASAAAMGGCSAGTGVAASSSDGTGGDIVLRAHVFDWTAPPQMESLLPPLVPPQQQQHQHQHQNKQQQLEQQQQQQSRVRPRQRRFDVVLACDVLYEDAAVGPISNVMPLLLEPAGGRLLLADPPNRTVRNRERFLEELRSGPLRLAVEECSVQQCEVSKLDNEMAGGLAPTAEAVPVQFLVFRSCVGNDTVGLKL